MIARVTLEVGELDQYKMFHRESYMTDKVDWSDRQELNRVFLEMVEKTKGSLDESN